MAATRNRYTSVAIFLHWLIAAAIFFQLALGWRMADLPKGPAAFSLFQLHKSIGFTILFLVLARIAWRLLNPPPPLPGTMAGWEKTLSKLVHLAFYGIMIGLPLTGWIMVSSSRTQIATLLFGTLHWPNLPLLGELSPSVKELWNGVAEGIHEALAIITVGLVALHVGGLLKHQLIVKDKVLAHMAPGARPGWGEIRLWLILVAAVAVFTAGFFLPRMTEYSRGRDNAMPLKAPRVVMEPTPPVVIPESVVVKPVAVLQPAKPIPAERVTVLAVPVKWVVGSGSRLDFATSWSGAAVEGQFKKWSADIVFSPEALAASSIKVTVDLASVFSGDEQRDGALPGEDWFDTGHFPQAVFKASRFKLLSPGHYSAQGELTLRGKTSPLTLDFKLAITGNQAVAEGSTRIDRTVFGVGQGDWAATDQIPATVDVTFKVRAKHP